MRAFVEAWLDVMPRVLAAVPEIDTMMPHDFVPGDVLEQKAPQTRWDYLAVLERKYARLLRAPASS